jgi:hypothetical protein
MMDKQLVLPGYEKIVASTAAEKPVYPDLPEMMQYLDDAEIFTDKGRILLLSKNFGLSEAEAEGIVAYWRQERGK